MHFIKNTCKNEFYYNEFLQPVLAQRNHLISTTKKIIAGAGMKVVSTVLVNATSSQTKFLITADL